MSIQQSTELIIFVTHVEAENSFLKIWGQVDKNSATCVERMILPLVEQFARSQGCVGSQSSTLRANALCCARFQNEGYYRAKVVNVRGDGMVVLQFIDYGNVEVLPPQEIHLLENIPGSESLQSFPPVAFEFTLMHVLPVNGVWENKIVESIKKILWYNEYKILIHTVVNNHLFIKLWYNNEDFSELMVNKRMAVRATLQEMFRSKCVQQMYPQPSKLVISNNCPPIQPLNPLRCDPTYQRPIPACCAAQQKQMLQSSVQEALVFKSRVLDVPSKHDVFVSCVEDGPQKFSVQLQSTTQILSQLMRDINSHSIEPLQEPPLPGSVCLGRYTRDKVLCRAVVMSVMENKCKLYYVDFGHTEVLPYTDIFQLPPHFISPKVLSIRFTLSGVNELNVTEEMKKYFKQIVSGKLLVLHVRPPEGPPLVQYGDLYDDGKNIKDVLRLAFSVPAKTKSLKLHYEVEKKIGKGMEEMVVVSFVESCRKFFVQLESNVKSLERIMESLAEFCATAPSLRFGQLGVGMACAALYDSQWYRAQILDILNSDTVKVLYVDYGNKETLPISSLRAIREDLIKNLPAQSIRCALSGWELLPCTQEIQNQFESLILEKRLRLRVAEAHSENMMVELFEPEKNESIKSRLLHAIRGENETEHQEAETPAKMIAKANQRSFAELQRDSRINVEATRCENRYHKKPSSDSWHQPTSDRSKYKTWKDESNEEKVHESRLEKPSNSYHRFNRDEFPATRRAIRQEPDTFKSGRGGSRLSTSRPKISTFAPKSHSSDKSWSDKDSDSSSRGGNRRGRGANRGNYRRSQSKQTEDSSFKSSKTGFDSHQSSGKLRERRGQGHRLAQNKLNATSSSSEGEKRRFNAIRNETNLKIPRSNLTLGDVKQGEVVFTNNCLDFFVQLSADFNALDAVMENIATVYESCSGENEEMKDADFVAGTFCVARYSEDQRWYRARIESVAEKNAVVQFVDYGNIETVPFDKIKSMQKQFAYLPIQAIRCKLLGAKNDPNNTKRFEDLVAGKSLEVEFISEENSIFVVLLKEDSGKIINEEFSEGIDLIKAKEEAKKDKTSPSTAKNSSSILTDYVNSDFDWNTVKYASETKKDVIITWFTNPNNFYCQVLDNEVEFRSMMNEIQKIYVGREPISNCLRVGMPVIAIFAEDGALYRAEILELNKTNGHLVQYIDFGNSAVVNARKIYAVEKSLTKLAKQAVQCSLRNVVSKDEKGWSKVDTKEIDACFNADKYECTFYEESEEKYMVTLVNERTNVAEMLVEKSLAALGSDGKAEKEESSTANAICDVEKVDINLLPGQTIRVKVSSFESASKFYVQLPSAAECQNIINAYMAEKNPEVMQRLSSREISLGTGCLVCSNGVWRRAAVEIASWPRSASGFPVKLIDTGALDEVHSDSVLALPGELSAMQNQAVECSVVSDGSDGGEELKEKVEGKEVIVYVDEVDNNRLLVHLYDATGLSLAESPPTTICPICPMPILTSTHKVIVSFADHSSSLWLQRNSDNILDQNLINSLDQHYSSPTTPIEPKENLICAVKGCDGHWYRGQILSSTENSVCVKFIDYGNNEQVPRDSIASLDPRFFVPYRLAINASLPVTLNGPIAEQLNVLQNYLSNRDLTGVFRNRDKKWLVELFSDGEKVSDKFRALNLVSSTENSTEDSHLVHRMCVGPKYDVYVSHVDSPSQFWLQCVEDAADLSRKQDKLQIEAPDFPKLDQILEEGSLCAAVYTIDNSWYRAEVIDADEDITTVRFVDYGNTDIIDNKTGNIRLIPDSWRGIPEYSIKCRLDVIPADSEDWPTSTCEEFERLITSVDSLQATIIANSVPKRVDLIISEKSVSETLVEQKQAIKVHTEEELIDEIVDLELDPHSAFVSHINSPNEFWVQEEKSVGNLEVMSDRFIMADMFDRVDNLREGLLCVAKYPEDKCWYRARVISVNDEFTNVIYVDYGNSAVSTEIRAIPADLADIPPLSRKCRLNIPEGVKEWSEKACEEFVNLAADGATIFLLDVLKEDETSVVKLTLDGRSVSDILAAFCESSLITEERLPPLGEENSPTVFVSRVNSPCDFWIQTESSSSDLNSMLDKLQSASSFLPLCSLEIGVICAAVFKEDDQWYRAKVLRVLDDNSAEVLFVDYGNVGISDEFRCLPLEIRNVAPLAKRCSLRKPENVKNWSLEACKRFESLANGETSFQLEILDDVCEPVCVKLSLQGRNVVDYLLEDLEENEEDTKMVKEENGDEYEADLSGFAEDMGNKSSGEEREAETSEFLGEDEENGGLGEENGGLGEENGSFGEEKSGSSVLELTVDEIVQNMKKEEFEEAEEEVEELSKDLSEFGSGEIENESEKVENFEVKVEEIEGENGGKGNLEVENDRGEGLEGQSNEKRDLEARGEKIEDFEGEKRTIIESQSEERENIELQSEERGNIELQIEERANIELQSEKRANIESQSEEKASIDSRSSKIEENIEARSEKSTDIESKSVETAEVETRSEKSATIESKSLEIESGSEKGVDIESKSVETAEVETRSEKSATIESKSLEIESGSEKGVDIESKSVEIAEVETRSEESATIESKSLEIESGSEKGADIESKSLETLEIECKSLEIADIASKSAEMDKNVELQSVESADIECRSVESANIECGSEKSAEIESKSVEIAENESRSTEIDSRSEKRASIESTSSEIANIESRSEKRAIIESKTSEVPNIETRSEKRAIIESTSAEKVPNIESTSSDIPNIETGSEKRAIIESTSSETPNIECTSEKRAIIESKSSETPNIDSKSPTVAKLDSKSATEEVSSNEETNPKASNSSFESNSTTEEKDEEKCKEVTEDSSISSKEDCETRENVERSLKNEECERIDKEDV